MTFPREAVEEQMKEYDISLSDGLAYVSSDLEQYYNVLNLLYSNYSKTFSNIKTLYDSGNIKDFGIAVHSMKSHAKSIGANLLYQLALSIESKAKTKETVFIDIALPLFFYQWDKTVRGMKYFLESYNKYYTPDTPVTAEELPSVNYSKSEYINKLIPYADNFQPDPALKLINAMISEHVTPGETEKLCMAAEYLNELEYDYAIKIFKEMM